MEKEILALNYDLEGIDTAARQFWEQLHTNALFAFSGEMGAGKTTFIHHLCDHLGVTDAVSSPTFALINEYHFADTAGSDKIIYHLDWYRLKNAEEAIIAGMEDCLAQAQKGAACCFIEWPEKAIELLQPPYLWISIEPDGDIRKRHMTVKLVN